MRDSGIRGLEGRCSFQCATPTTSWCLVPGRRKTPWRRRSALADHLRLSTGLELSPEKTRVTAVTDGFEFLGFHVHHAMGSNATATARASKYPKQRPADLRRKVKQLTGRNSHPGQLLARSSKRLNPILRGWANYYRYCADAGRVFASLDWYISDRLWRWLRKKRPKASAGDILGSRSQQSPTDATSLAGRFSRAILARLDPGPPIPPRMDEERRTSPCLLESRMRNERRTSGSGRGDEKPAAERRHGARRLLTPM